jgi:hypothetical protein
LDRVAGNALPFTFDAEYALYHGYRELRHDVNPGLQFPCQWGFSLQRGAHAEQI